MDKWSPPEEKPLGMKEKSRCKRAECNNGLHCFLKHKKRKTSEGSCWACGVDVIDWTRVHKRDIDDIEHTVNALKNERIRHEFWCVVPLTEYAIMHTRHFGKDGLLEAARNRIRVAVGKPANGRWDGQQTPWEDKANALQFAQHATATCCRKCIAVWHGISSNRPLAEDEIEYFAQLVHHFVLERIPDLPNEPMKRTRKTSSKGPIKGIRKTTPATKTNAA